MIFAKITDTHTDTVMGMHLAIGKILPIFLKRQTTATVKGHKSIGMKNKSDKSVKVHKKMLRKVNTTS